MIVAIGLLLIAMRAGKRRRNAEAPEDDRVTPEPAVVPPAPEVTHSAAHDTHSHPATGAADLEGVAVQRGQGELNAVAASMENYDAAQSFDTPTEDTPLTPTEATPGVDNDDAARVTLSAAVAPTEPEPDTRRAPFMPDAPAALHRDFTPPRPGAVEAALAAERAATERAAALERATREAIEREAAERELEAKEAAEREAQEREAERLAAEAREAEAREVATREAAAREAEVREAKARETAAREAEAQARAQAEAQARAEAQAQAQAEAQAEAEAEAQAEAQAQAQAAAAREASERQAELHAAPPADHANSPNDDSYDDEPSSAASRLPQPKFPQEAIEALSALDFGLPPRREVSREAEQAQTPKQPEIVPSAITPQPIADPAVFDQQNEQHCHPDALSKPPAASVAQQIETGTAGAASVAGLGASRFGPLSLDFDYDSPSSQTEPLPAFTPEQIATIARNKLELAVEYIELGDLSGARTLLQEVIESNDPATRQPAATLLSTLAPLS
ncbi:hypothetical protein ASG35_14655 [Burkholderia sp. Leaf177]|nr:hypothetical protein ASG35_14655 [Burkholderia sp. Leaf177]